MAEIEKITPDSLLAEVEAELAREGRAQLAATLGRNATIYRKFTIDTAEREARPHITQLGAEARKKRLWWKISGLFNPAAEPLLHKWSYFFSKAQAKPDRLTLSADLVQSWYLEGWKQADDGPRPKVIVITNDRSVFTPDKVSFSGTVQKVRDRAIDRSGTKGYPVFVDIDEKSKHYTQMFTWSSKIDDIVPPNARFVSFNQGRLRGAEAYAEGHQAPYNDPALRGAYNDQEPQPTNQYLDGWKRGWSEAHVKATRFDFSKNSKGKQTQQASFQKWFSGSKIVDKAGQPLLVFHGTEANFNEFRIPPNGVAYFTPNPNYGYIKKATIVYSAYLSVKRPYFTDDFQPFIERLRSSPEDVVDLKQKGYDGVVHADPKDLTKTLSGWGNDYPQIAVFYSDQIRRAEDGGFDFSKNGKAVGKKRHSPLSKKVILDTGLEMDRPQSKIEPWPNATHFEARLAERTGIGAGDPPSVKSHRFHQIAQQIVDILNETMPEQIPLTEHGGTMRALVPVPGWGCAFLWAYKHRLILRSWWPIGSEAGVQSAWPEETSQRIAAVLRANA